jgi:hypothetical protein
VKSAVKKNPACRFADLVALVRFALEQQPVLQPFAESVEERFNEWLRTKDAAVHQLSTIIHQPAAPGLRAFTADQLSWLRLIRDHIATSLSIEPDDFDYAPFSQRGGLGNAHQLFGEQLPALLDELNEVLFLKMADEQSRPPFNKPSTISKGYNWPSLLAKDGDELETHYRHVLERLGKQPGMLGVIFRKAQNKIQDPAKLRRLIVDLIDKEQWSSLSADVKGDAYEGLLQKNAEDVKGGAGQYFTPRPLIGAIVDAVAPQPGQTICDPACGTGGFLLAAHDYIAKHHALDRAQKKKLKSGTLFGIELLKRDKVNLDIFWLKDESLEESANLPVPEVIAQEIADDLQAALEQFATIAEDLKE